MSKESGARFIERLFPGLRPHFIKTADDEDVCQIVLCDMLGKWNTLHIHTDEEFTQTFSRFFGTRKWIERGRRVRQLTSGTYWLRHAGGIPIKYLGHRIGNKYGHGRSHETDLAIPSAPSLTTQYNPWCNNRIEALEWIAQLPTPLYKRLLTLYYIEGYTLSEIEALLNWPRDRAGIVIKEGVAYLQHIRKCELEEEGRSANVGPTLTTSL